MLGFGAGNFLIERLVDRHGMARVLAVVGVGLGLAYFAAAQSPSVMVLSLWQLVIGFGTGACFAPLIADISQWFLKRRGLAVAIAASGNYLAGAVWPVALDWVGGGAGWRWDYSALALVSVVILVPISFALRTRVDAGAIAVSEAQAAARAGQTGLSPRQRNGRWALPGSAAVWRWQCRRSTSWRSASTWGSGLRWDAKCCRSCFWAALPRACFLA